MKLRLFCYGLIVFITVSFFSSCQTTAPLYYWGSYETQVYSYLTGENIIPQIQALENDLQIALAEDKQLPPGFFAHLGFLYAEMGNRQKAIEYFNEEKARFPEAEDFINFVLSRIGA